MEKSRHPGNWLTSSRDQNRNCKVAIKLSKLPKGGVALIRLNGKCIYLVAVVVLSSDGTYTKVYGYTEAIGESYSKGSKKRKSEKLS